MMYDDRQPAFPLLIATSAMAVVWLACLAVSFLAVRQAYSPMVGSGAVALAGTGVVGFWLMITLIPVAALGPWGVMPTVYGYFLGCGARFLGCFGFCAWVLMSGALPGDPTVLSVVIAYVPLTLVDAAFVGRYLWQKDFLIEGMSGRRIGEASPC